MCIVIKNHNDKNLYDYLSDCPFRHKEDWVLDIGNIKQLLNKYLWYQ